MRLFQYKYISSALFFFLSAWFALTLFKIWGNPIGPVGLESVSRAMFFLAISFVAFFTPSVLFSSVLFAEPKNILQTFAGIVLFLIVQTFFLFFTVFSGEGALGLFQVYSYSAFAFLSLVFGIPLRYILGNNPKILSFLFVVPAILLIIITYRVMDYQKPTPIMCQELNIYGQTYCYERIAENTKNPLWCYAITAADNVVSECVSNLSSIEIDPDQCQSLPNEESKGICVRYTTAEKGDVRDCEKQSSYTMYGCISNIVNANKGDGSITDCSLLNETVNRKTCYKTWIVESGQGYTLCNQIKNLPERELCLFSYAYGAYGDVRSMEFMRHICASLTNLGLKTECLSSLNK